MSSMKYGESLFIIFLSNVRVKDKKMDDEVTGLFVVLKSLDRYICGKKTRIKV